MDASSPWIVAGTEENFDALMARSQEIPILIDFWAPWCQPCLQLAPLLEKTAAEGNGQFLLVKVNCDEQPNLAGSFGVQSIPHLFMVKDGQLADQIRGMVTEPQLTQWLAKFQPSPAQQMLAEAQKLEAENTEEAEAKYLEAIAADASLDQARIKLAQLYLRLHRDPDAVELLNKLEARGFLEPEAEAVKAELELRAAAADSGDLADCRAAVAANPADLSLKIKLADALAVAHQYPEACELCLDVVANDFGPARDEARQTMVKIFQLLGNESELTQKFRRRLATLLY